jgi:predicted Zn-dependent protease
LAEEVVLEKIERDPGNPLWHQFHGDLLASRRQYAEAIQAFERSLRLYPDNPEALNNLAWLLLTADQRTLLDPVRALALAKQAVALQARSHILDTLAEAYWQNGLAEMAIETEQRAVAESSDNRDYYRKQLRKFSRDERS